METHSDDLIFCHLVSFPAYLQGMETYQRLLLAFQQVGSQPTYKEWKRVDLPELHVDAGAFPAYLQGMETTYQVSDALS